VGGQVEPVRTSFDCAITCGRLEVGNQLLTERQFGAYCDGLGFPSATVALIKRIRSSPPSRRVGGGRESVPGSYSSAKNGFGVQFESHTVEFHVVYKLEHDSDALEYYCQPEPIQLKYFGKTGKPVVVWHTPDYFVLWRDRAGWIEAKHEDKLRTLADESPNRFQSLDGRWECPPGREYAEERSLCYELHSSASISTDFVRNAQFLDDYWRSPDPVQTASMDAVARCLAHTPAITLESLLAETQHCVPPDDIYQMLAKRTIHFDWSAAPLVEPQRVHVFADEQAAIQFHAAASCRRLSVGVINLRAGGHLEWDGKSWNILNVGNNNLSLLGENNRHTELPAMVVEDLIRQGRIVYASEEQQIEAEHPHVQLLLSQATPNDLMIANKRAEFAQRVIRGEHGAKGRDLSRSERRYVTQFSRAKELYGNGYIGLLPQTRLKGNRTPRLEEDTQSALSESIEQEYEHTNQPKAFSCWSRLKAKLDAAGQYCPSYKTYCKQVRKAPRHRQTLKRKGRRAAYNTSEFYWSLDQKVPRHGDRPFEIGHIDHTELDIELVSKLGLKRPRRVWLTILIDAFTRRVLAFYLTFDEPSYRSCMMVLRECVRIHQRMPQILVVDGGREFKSTYFDFVIARFEKTKKTRPAAKARFGSVCERYFGTTNTQFIYNLIGNTQITKNVRQVTKSNNPQNLAVWDFESLYVQLKEYFYEVYDTIEHPALGMSPRAAFLLAMQNSGARLKSLIRYDQQFLMETAPSTAKGTAKVWPGRGVTINYFLYWSEAFRDPRVENRNVPVRYDPWNAAIAWAYVNGQWVLCHSPHQSTLNGRSEKEIKIATSLLRDQMRSTGQVRLTITATKLANFLNGAKQHEALLLQRARDLESQCARDRDAKVQQPERSVAHDGQNIEPQAHKKAEREVVAPVAKRKIEIYGDL
jgi:putative transposase